MCTPSRSLSTSWRMVSDDKRRGHEKARTPRWVGQLVGVHVAHHAAHVKQTRDGLVVLVAHLHIRARAQTTHDGHERAGVLRGVVGGPWTLWTSRPASRRHGRASASAIGIARARRDHLEARDLDGQTFVTFGKRDHLHRYFMETCTELGVAPKQPSPKDRGPRARRGNYAIPGPFPS